MPNEFQPGQRWISESEPELGLGTILHTTTRTVTAEFKASEQKREYARSNSPLRRVRFRPGDAIESRKARVLTVQEVIERDGILFYRSGTLELCETDLSDTISFNKPAERLFAGQFDPERLFELRVAALEHQHRRRRSAIRGFCGGRIDLIPHQIYIASEVAGRLAPRVLLADEVGLGKTIEACLILHRLIVTGRAQRILILVPESLVHQWFVELLRRFNLWFHIYDEPRCMESGDRNPFLEAQFILCSISVLSASERRVQESLDAGWDVLVVDEAHHLGWTPDATSPEYALVQSLGSKTQGLLLLTATPEQLGMASHFARLRLLDPDRFHDLDQFLRETEHFRQIARKAQHLEDGPELDTLLDQHGTGRVQFRNTRDVIAGFPRRLAHLYPLSTRKSKDPRIHWLITLLQELEQEKVLLICRTRDTVTSIERGIRQQIRLDMAVFHDGLTLVQRDRNAAWFAEERGARLLICSEIGSEGRNFQFAHHLVLFDLPLDPEVLEQRIGRLDRIGQTSEIHIHVPFAENSFQEVLALWHHDGLNSFEQQLLGGRELWEQFGHRVQDVSSREELAQLIADTRSAHTTVAARLHEGRDRLLERHSFRPRAARQLVEQIRAQDSDTTLDEFMLAIFDAYSIAVEEIAERTYRVGSAGVLAESFPGLPAGGFTVTCNRNRALAREDMQFLTWDHPLVTGALDLLLCSEKGNASLGQGLAAGIEGVTLEAVFVLECIAPSSLHIDRFLPPTPLRVTVVGDELETLLVQARENAEQETAGMVKSALRAMNAQLQFEITRLKQLRAVNPSLRAEEIDLLLEQQRALDEHLSAARLRLDALRISPGKPEQ